MPDLFVPHTPTDYHLIDVVGENESHPLAPLMEVVGVLIERYEDEHVPQLTEA